MKGEVLFVIAQLILYIDDGVNKYVIEPTATDESTMMKWNEYRLSGWKEKIT